MKAVGGAVFDESRELGKNISSDIERVLVQWTEAGVPGWGQRLLQELLYLDEVSLEFPIVQQERRVGPRGQVFEFCWFLSCRRWSQ
uniref:Uncharacterized protein n=1 Tax=Anguilla anguilla TaxID=7936 RepID=A0A0E9X7A4_ANGAN